MKKYMIIYHAPAAAWGQMETMTDEQKEQGMQVWRDWMEKCGDNLVDGGSPLMFGENLDANGGSTPSSREVAGYSVLQAESKDAVKELLKGHPHFMWAEGCSIEIHESMPM